MSNTCHQMPWNHLYSRFIALINLKQALYKQLGPVHFRGYQDVMTFNLVSNEVALSF